MENPLKIFLDLLYINIRTLKLNTMTHKQWNKMRIEFNSNPLTVGEILNALSNYRIEGDILEHSYEFSQKVMDSLIEKYPTLCYALYHHHFIIDFDTRHIGTECWIGYDPSVR